jgi:hypothetical protein
VASGEVEIGIIFPPGMTDPGIDMVGPLPRDVSPPTIVFGFVPSHADDPAAVKQLLKPFFARRAATSKTQKFSQVAKLLPGPPAVSLAPYRVEERLDCRFGRAYAPQCKSFGYQ